MGKHLDEGVPDRSDDTYLMNGLITRKELVRIIVDEFDLKPVARYGVSTEPEGYWIIPTEDTDSVRGMIRMLYIDRVDSETYNGTLFLTDHPQAVVFATTNEHSETEWILADVNT